MADVINMIESGPNSQVERVVQERYMVIDSAFELMKPLTDHLIAQLSGTTVDTDTRDRIVSQLAESPGSIQTISKLDPNSMTDTGLSDLHRNASALRFQYKRDMSAINKQIDHVNRIALKADDQLRDFERTN